ncbi:MAG: competence/damage-inducible protein A [Bacteroidales bacterium]|jgi:nicotinamide-nucleotide amidase|nr:competence/damage-inducible protein A [Bacteroidales bacterium]
MEKILKAEIITIGDELLIGQVVDTNSAYIAKELNSIGIAVCRITSVPDVRQPILDALKDASQRAEAVLITGGLGPTKDDITKSALAEYAGDRLVMHEETLRHIEAMMAARHIAMNPLTRQQAETPEHAVVIPNRCGTAPGLWFEKDGVVHVSMPGVPFEMKAMMREEILPRLQPLSSGAIFHRTALVYGIAESALAMQIERWEAQLPSHIKLAYLPSSGMIRLRLSASGSNRDTLEKQVEKAIADLRPLLHHHLLTADAASPEELAGQLLTERKKTVATAESCTGGNIARLLTSIAGSSGYFKGAVVSYANSVKTQLLKVRPEDIARYGAVSREVAEQMARHVRMLMSTDYGIAVSGIAGPAGGTDEKPVGTVWIALADTSQVTARCYHFGNNRENNILRASNAALNMLIEELKKEKQE